MNTAAIRLPDTRMIIFFIINPPVHSTDLESLRFGILVEPISKSNFIMNRSPIVIDPKIPKGCHSGLVGIDSYRDPESSLF